uniref:laccase n=1 Tax=Aegilops tauschii TaxID=37682 RepID=R7W4T4_AEGTA
MSKKSERPAEKNSTMVAAPIGAGPMSPAVVRVDEVVGVDDGDAGDGLVLDEDEGGGWTAASRRSRRRAKLESWRWPRHGLKHRLNCWADGVPMITQCPIRPGHNFRYRLNVTEQEGTLWWHAHVSCLRASLHGAFIIRPRHANPFPKPDKEIPIVIGEWWSMNLAQLGKNMEDGFYDDTGATTINGKLGDLYNCSGVVEDGLVLDVEPGKTYLLRLLNVALYSEYYVKIAGHELTEVGADANYVRPFTTDVVAIGPGETLDALVVANAIPGKYYMVAVSGQAPKPDIQIPATLSRAMVRYAIGAGNGDEAAPPVAPEMPDQHDFMVSFYFHGNLSSLNRPGSPPVPATADESLFVVLRMGSICRQGRLFCRRSGSKESIIVETMNNNAAMMDTDNHPVHLHGHDMFVLARGHDNYDAARDVARFNLVDPPLKNTVLVPRLGWAVVRFVADNPGAYPGHMGLFIQSFQYVCHKLFILVSLRIWKL